MPAPVGRNRSSGFPAIPTIAVSTLLTITLVQCAAPRADSTYDLFIIPERDFFTNTERIALVPLYFEADLEVPDTIVTVFDSLVQAEMEEAGFSVLPSLVYEEIWRRIVEDVGGIFDPYTGMRIEERFQAATTRLRQELNEKFNPDVLLATELWVVEAPYRDALVSWDGTTQDIAGSRFRRGRDGTVFAITLGVVVEDLEGAELYVNGGGVEVLETLEGTVPPEALFADRERIRNAVRTALQPLTRGRPEAPAR